MAKNIAKSTNKEGVKAAQLGMAERPDRTEILENLDAKILIIAGKYDNAVKTENLLKIILKDQHQNLCSRLRTQRTLGKTNNLLQKLSIQIVA